MQDSNLQMNTISEILPQEFYQLIENNAEHIRKTFPVTLASCIDLQSTIDFIAKNIEKEKNNEGHHFYIRNKKTKGLVGYVCVKNVNPTIRKCELAYFIDKEFEGKGIVSNAVAKTLDFCFNDLKMNKIFICTSKINMASQRIAIKHGFSKEGILREEFKSGDAILEDIVYFGLLESEYHEK